MQSFANDSVRRMMAERQSYHRTFEYFCAQRTNAQGLRTHLHQAFATASSQRVNCWVGEVLAKKTTFCGPGGLFKNRDGNLLGGWFRHDEAGSLRSGLFSHQVAQTSGVGASRNATAGPMLRRLHELRQISSGATWSNLAEGTSYLHHPYTYNVYTHAGLW